MLANEAKWFCDRLHLLAKAGPVLNLGSGTKQLRTKRQPYIQTHLLGPLAGMGVRVINSDLKKGEGVDVAGDIFASATQEQIRRLEPRALLCLNILEHVADRRAFASLCMQLLPPSSLLFVSVPRAFPFHPDPIDTMYRPTPEEIAQLFGGCKVVDSAVVRCETFGQQIVRRPRRAIGWLSHLVVPFPTVSHLKAAWLKAPWLMRNYEVSCAVLQKT